MHLFIVESPSKTKIIQKYLGDEYQCIATCGHFMDIPHSLDWIDSVDWSDIPYNVHSAKHAHAIKKAAKNATPVIYGTIYSKECKQKVSSKV